MSINQTTETAVMKGGAALTSGSVVAQFLIQNAEIFTIGFGFIGMCCMVGSFLVTLNKNSREKSEKKRAEERREEEHALQMQLLKKKLGNE